MVAPVAFSKVQAALAESRPVRTAREGDTAHAAPASAAAPAPVDRDQASVPAFDPSALESAVSKMSERARTLERALQFSIDENSGETVITVIDKHTREVIRRIPPDEVVSLAERFGNGPGMLVTLEA